MKFLQLLNLTFDFCGNRKMGAETIALGVGSAIAGLGSTALSIDSQESNVDKQLLAQHRENQLNRDWQTAEAERARQFQSSQQEKAFSQTGQLMDRQAQYNSPVYQSQQLRLAGLNPQVYYGRNSSFGGSSVPSAPSTPGASMPGSVSGLSPVSFQPAYLNAAALSSSFGQVVKNLAEAKKTGIESSWINDTTAAQIRKLNADSTLTELMQVQQKVSNDVAKSSAPAQIKKAFEDVNEVISKIKLNEKGLLTADSQIALNGALEKYNNALNHLTNKERDNLDLTMKFYPAVARSIIAKNSADASLAAAQTKTENDLRDLRKEAIRLANDAQDNANNFNVATFNTRIEELVSKIGLVKVNTALAELARKDKDAYSTFQRVLLGHGSPSDVTKFAKFLADGGEFVTYFNSKP